MMEFTPDQWVKIILAILAIVSTIIVAIFAVNKRSHKIGNITGNGNHTQNGDKIGKK